MEGGAPGQQPLPLSSPLRNEHCKYHTSRMANIFQQTLQKTVMPNTNIFFVAFQIKDMYREILIQPLRSLNFVIFYWHDYEKPWYCTFCVFLNPSTTFHMLLSYVIVIEIAHALWLCLQGFLPSLQIALNCNFSSCGFTMGTALYYIAFGCTIAHCSLHWWAHSEKGSAALSEKGSAAAFLNWLLMMGAGTLSANFLIHTSGNSQPNMSCRL